LEAARLAATWPEAKAVVKYRLPQNLELTGTGAYKGRAPSLRERFDATNGNRDLGPERIAHAEVRAVEADAVAALARRIKDDAWQIVDAVTGEMRTARYDDVALLLPTRTALPDLEDALERADVPVRIESQSLVFSTALR